MSLTDPWRRFLLNYTPDWLLYNERLPLPDFGERLTQGWLGLAGSILLETARGAVAAALLEDDAPDDAVAIKGRERTTDRYPEDTSATHAARIKTSWSTFGDAGTDAMMLEQLALIGHAVAYLIGVTDDPARPRRFYAMVSTEGDPSPPDPEKRVRLIFRVLNKFRAGEERLVDATVLTAGRTWDLHPATGLPHTWDSPGPGITTWDSSAGVTYRDIAGTSS
jgi:hypothetical protein